MFGDLLGNLEQQQAEIQKKLKTIQVQGQAGDGAVTVTCNAAKEVLKVNFDTSKLDWNDKEMVEDLLIVAINNAIQEASEKEAIESQQAMRSIMPPGLEGMFGM